MKKLMWFGVGVMVGQMVLAYRIEAARRRRAAELLARIEKLKEATREGMAPIPEDPFGLDDRPQWSDGYAEYFGA